MAAENNSLKSIILALFANSGIAVAKYIAAFFTGSGSMLAEAIHSTADCGNQLLLILGLRRTRKEPDEAHPLGYGKAIYFWSFIVALMLFSIGGMFSIYEGIHKIAEPSELRLPYLAIGILALSIVLESIALFGALGQIKKEKDYTTLFKWFRSTRKSEFIVILGEDMAAVLGLVFALLAIIATHITGNPVFDAIGSIFIGVILIVVATFIGIEVKSLMVGESADAATRNEIKNFIESQDNVDLVFNMITLQLGPDVMLAVKLKLNQNLSSADMVKTINIIEKKVKSEFSGIRFSFFEPDLTDGAD